MFRITATPCIGANSPANCVATVDASPDLPADALGQVVAEAFAKTFEAGHEPNTAGLLMVVQVAAILPEPKAEDEAGWPSDASAIDEIAKPE